MELSVTESILLFTGIILLAIATLALIKKNVAEAVLCLGVLVVLIAFVILTNSNRITKSRLVQRLNPDVPVKGYRWIGANAWVLYKDGKEENVVIYEK